ncbi:hypothetical protein [Streptomyces sp. WM6378]|uniref:hypothetical protein n=1 Tax=Streptomyces sp. WM6378 TaxID=1415557 RepID=UPI0006AF0E83|nr:hypothetical protein [Streptomyces sp. WM6378]KOU43209.1 hypothetical protein ADK54_17985 [Streptomyces sp. WM6378]
MATQYPLSGVSRVIHPDGTVDRVEFHDRPQTADETRAFAKYRDLSPLELMRQLRTAEWNADVAQSERDQWKASAQRLQMELAQAERKLAAITPDGWELPKTVRALLAHAEAHGWRSARAWTPRGTDEMLLKVVLGRDALPSDAPSRGAQWRFELTWICVPGSARRARAGLVRTPDRPQWHDAPSVRKIRELIREHSYAKGAA